MLYYLKRAGVLFSILRAPIGQNAINSTTPVIAPVTGIPSNPLHLATKRHGGWGAALIIGHYGEAGGGIIYIWANGAKSP
jgi:hypothetical protein